MTRSPRTLHVVGTKDVHTLVREMEFEIGEALRLSNALALSIEGIGKMTFMEKEHEVSALRMLAVEASSSAAKVQEQWDELFELSKCERG
jgi:hypothetical protein